MASMVSSIASSWLSSRRVDMASRMSITAPQIITSAATPTSSRTMRGLKSYCGEITTSIITPRISKISRLLMMMA